MRVFRGLDRQSREVGLAALIVLMPLVLGVLHVAALSGR